ncbi:hypothetical protein [Actinophytocola sediminis]
MTWTRRLTSALLVLVAVSGCVSRTGGTDGTPVPGDREPEQAPPTAADGSDVSACADGDCEVLLEDSQTIPVPDGTLTITLVGDNRVEYEVSIAGGGSSGSTEGNCVSTFTLDGTGSGSVCAAGGGPALEPDPGPGELAMVVTGQDIGTPILLLAIGS